MNNFTRDYDGQRSNHKQTVRLRLKTIEQQKPFKRYIIALYIIIIIDYFGNIKRQYALYASRGDLTEKVSLTNNNIDIINIES
jgi:1,4-dihydroxy-2-naphthoate octaprenyltransferase